MSWKNQIARGVLALSLCIGMATLACGDSSPESPDPASTPSTVSGAVVFDQTGEPAPGITVDLERCEEGRMMMSDEWGHFGSMMTDSQGHFHFEYRHESMHHYRVAVRGMTGPDSACDLDGGNPHNIVLRIP